MDVVDHISNLYQKFLCGFLWHIIWFMILTVTCFRIQNRFTSCFSIKRRILLSTCFARNYNHSNTLRIHYGVHSVLWASEIFFKFSSDDMKPANSLMGTGFFTDNIFKLGERKLKQTVISRLLGKVLVAFKMHMTNHNLSFCVSSILTHSICFDNCYKL